MTAKVAKREIYARLGVQLRNNRRAFKAERMAPGAMGLYAFMVMDARSELPELDGFVPEEVVLSAWGRPAEERSAQVEALCAVDLVERAEGGYVVVKYDEHNDTRAVVESNRKAAAKRMRHVRANKHRTSPEQSTNISRTEGACSPDVPYSSSLSNSPSGSGSDLGSRESTPGASDDAMPEWFTSAAATVADNLTGGEPLTELPARWLEYRGSRVRKGWAKGREDALAWLSTVVRSERRNAREGPKARGAEITKQPYDADAPWMKLPEAR